MKRGKRGSGRGGEQPSDPQKPKVNPGLQLPPPRDQALGGQLEAWHPRDGRLPALGNHRQTWKQIFTAL